MLNLYDKKHAWILGGFEFLHADTTVEANPGSGGATFAADAAAGGELHPYTKMEFGASGTQTPVSAANPLPVVQTGTPGLPTGASTAAAQTTGNGHLATLAGAVAGTEMQVDIVASAAIPVTDNGGSLTVDAASLPLPTGASTAANQTTANTSLATLAGAVAGTEVQVDVLTSALPTGAATEAKQPALGTAGTASADVVTVQGVASMTPLQIADNGGSITVDGTVSLAAGTNTNEVVGDAAHGAAAAGNPVLVGMEARSTDGAAVDSGDVVRPMADLNGKQIVLPYAIPENFEYGVSAAKTDTAATEMLAAAGAGVRHYITSLSVVNSHATVGTVVEIRDGTTTVIHRGYAAPVGGGYAVNFPVPLRCTANTAVNAYNITTGSNTYVSVSGYKAP